MVAAHLNDLKAAKENGLQTIYVERPGEEGWVDLWIGSDGNRGFITVAEKLGVNLSTSDQSTRLSTSAPAGGA